MELFIQVRDGQPVGHPIPGENFRQAFPGIDTDNLPPEFARFQRIPRPKVTGVYDVIEGPRYQFSAGMVRDSWTVRPMTIEEKSEKNEALSKDAYGLLNILKDVAQAGVNQALTETVRQAWTDYLAALNAWVLVDPANPAFPAQPKIQSDGTVATTTSAGSAPDVIG